MRLCICGSRTLSPAAPEIEKFVVEIEKTMGSVVKTLLHGGAIGADLAAGAWAETRGVMTIVELPNYRTYGTGAPLIRNIALGAQSDAILALWDGQSNGTQHMIKTVGPMFKIPVFVQRLR